jgi:hypothetical protein
MKASAVVFVLLLLAVPALATECVIYDSVHEDNRPAVDAATFLGFDVHAYESGEEQLFIDDLADGADIVVFDCNSDYSARVSYQLDAIQTFLTNYPSGNAAVALWYMGYEPTHPLWTTMDVSYCFDFTETKPIYHWVAHPIWDGIPNPIRSEETGWYRDGANVEPIGGPNVQAIGGFTATSAYCEAGLVIGDDGRTVYIGETGRGGTYDDDSDGIRDWEELYRNIFTSFTVVPVEGATWGAVKAMYR